MKLRQKRGTHQENGTHRVDSDRKINGGKILNSEGSRKLAKKRKLIDFESLPDYMKDNEFIRDHYRCEWPLNDVAFSVFSVHNETVNIWTHLVGFVIFAWFTAVSLTETATVENLVNSFLRLTRNGPLMGVKAEAMNGSDPLLQGYNLSYIPSSPSSILHHGKPDVIPTWPWFVFLAGAMCCLMLSSISHLFACHSKHFHRLFWRLDYVGIAVMIMSSFIPPIYYTFACHPFSRLAYLTGIVSAGAAAVVTLLSPALSAGKYRAFRTGLFLSMGFSGVVPAAHAAVLFWGRHPQINVALGYEVLMGVLYAAGAVLYVSRVPERWRPGAFDIVGHSHQIFHVLVVAAALAHSAATLVIMDWRRGLQVC